MPSSVDDQEVLQASQISLERKSKIYDRLTREAPEFDEMDEEQLIDFERKKMEGLKQPAEGSSQPFFKDDPWVEHVDEFGRTRIVRQSEARELQKSDGEILFDNEMDSAVKREEERLEWERQRAEKNKGPIHYDANEEYRTRGVGFYKFSNIEEERKAQMEQLKQLREDTDRKRALQQSIKDKRNAQLQDRIKKIRLLQSSHHPKLLYPPPLFVTGSTQKMKGECSTDLDIQLLTLEVNYFLNECKRLV
ncbi:hypothetical protein L0F63_001822 [Massospora cicadina]|nr:hypothetical protein L0F63_001822 [Massospora cicadina]